MGFLDLLREPNKAPRSAKKSLQTKNLEVELYALKYKGKRVWQDNNRVHYNTQQWLAAAKFATDYV